MDEEDEFEYSDEDTDEYMSETRRSVPSVIHSPIEKQKFKVLSAKDIVLRQNLLIKEVAALLFLDADACTILMLHFAWNKEKLIEKYYASQESKFI